jgi:phage shock protein E
MKAITAIMLFILPIFAFATESVWVDVRSSSEFDGGHLEAATNIPHGDITEKLPAIAGDKNTEILLYCRSGNRAGIAQRALEAEGYTNVKNIGSLNDARAYEAKRQQADISVKPEQMM